MGREPIKKSVRFDVFKRDSFTCQYCGQKAPDVVLEVDHITPVAAGGDNDILNLVTACKACNSGKSDRALSDTAVVKKARVQAEDLEDRRQQLEMIAQWHLSLVDIESQASAQLERLWFEAINADPSTYLLDHARAEIRRWSKSYGYERVCQAIVKAANNLLLSGLEKDQEERSAAFWSIQKICAVMRADDNDPGISRLFYIRGIVRNRCRYVNERACIALLKEARDVGVDVERMVDFAKYVTSWSTFRDTIQQEIRSVHAEAEEAAYGPHP
jgi:hypothetical protein